MQSLDESITLKSIYYPYYYAIFNNVPHNPFSVILFSYLGEISPSIYKNNLENFINYLNKIELTKDKNVFVKKIVDNYNVKSEKWIKNLIEDIQVDNSPNFIIYYLLSVYFNLSLKFFKLKENVINSLHDDNIYFNREIYLLLNDEKIPFNVLKQDTNGNIRVYSVSL